MTPAFVESTKKNSTPHLKQSTGRRHFRLDGVFPGDSMYNKVPSGPRGNRYKWSNGPDQWPKINGFASYSKGL